ncbi:MAG: Dephospho-CoA kinase [Candidatus Omnitrophica bacterium]|nr:Dephospho-CoA kinase [Candidatus Omnitrophota bacterium]
MIVVGLTGGLATGKTQAARIFKKLGARIFDADEVARRLLRRGTPAYRGVVQIFGADYLGPKGDIDRAKLARRVFSSPKDLKKLNTLVHPGVIFECLQVIRRLKGRKGLLVLDVPLLFESHMERMADVTVVVKAKPATVYARTDKKGLSRKLARAIIASQWSLARKARLADHVLDNDGTPKELEQQVREVRERILRTRPEDLKRFYLNEGGK